MDIYIISLEQAIDRRESISKQFAEADIPFKFFNAVDGRKEKHSLFNHYNEKKRLLYKGYPMTPGELGCFASHYLLWQKCIENNKPMIIIEDDAQLIPENFISFLTNIALFKEYEYLRLFVNNRKRKFVPLHSKLGFTIVEYLRGPGATRGYFITPIAAQKFVTHAKEWTLAVDDYMDQFWFNLVACLGIMPGVVKNETEFESCISANERKNKKNRLTREIYNLIMSIRRSFYLLKHKNRRQLNKRDQTH